MILQLSKSVKLLLAPATTAGIFQPLANLSDPASARVNSMYSASLRGENKKVRKGLFCVLTIH
jgi:hypothetical protein